MQFFKPFFAASEP